MGIPRRRRRLKVIADFSSIAIRCQICSVCQFSCVLSYTGANSEYIAVEISHFSLHISSRLWLHGAGQTVCHLCDAPHILIFVQTQGLISHSRRLQNDKRLITGIILSFFRGGGTLPFCHWREILQKHFKVNSFQSNSPNLKVLLSCTILVIKSYITYKYISIHFRQCFPE